MPEALKMGFSPCPNDTFIFHALATGAVPWPGAIAVTLADVEELNAMATAGRLDVVKVSAAAVAGILDEYVLLRAGGAMGHGVGPVLVGREASGGLAALNGARVAIPGRMTTAALLFGLCCREAGISVEVVPMVFDEVMEAVVAGRVAAGVVIHEGRFTYAAKGLARILDLGAWWEAHSGLPIPLGAIAMRRSMGQEAAQAMNEAIRRSLLAARANPQGAWDYVKAHAQEMDDTVILRHIETFVTDYSLDVGEAGERAMTRLLAEAQPDAGRDCPVFITRRREPAACGPG
ncbi:1,4-dihydroxy-6-naphthoate synthase [Pseudodesulfovibrio pelocollis]|uniref:1,4-dihydroxy-6-naphthoate synthase n=1 Tax=Pseudodesulfovibrio pelocollis TaxID=3051432 RepID=UPI00255A8BFD|nr:1,4-dihydroxy-6-naphthoate synthase [Pseudodesulfovibrio sp. SB368]